MESQNTDVWGCGDVGSKRCVICAHDTPHSRDTSPYFPGNRLAHPEQVQVSIRRIQYEKAWTKVEEMQANDVVFEGSIVAVNRGGAIVLVQVTSLSHPY